MAVDFNATKLLFWARNLGVSFDRTITLGRQGFVCLPSNLRRAAREFGFGASASDLARCHERPAFTALYADEFFRLLGAKELVSVDRSDFEGATLLHDLNEPFETKERESFDFVFDGGTLEHIFNYPAALRHCLELVGPGGHFLTCAPADNFMGHGFYQISPELFFRVFNQQNGFSLRKLVLHDAYMEDAPFYEVLDPAATGKRTYLLSSRPMMLAALAQRTAIRPLLKEPPQQSDYAAVWDRHRQASLNPVTSEPTLMRRIRIALNPLWPERLREWKRALLTKRHMGSPKLSNREQFRRIPRSEICAERARANESAKSVTASEPPEK